MPKNLRPLFTIALSAIALMGTARIEAAETDAKAAEVLTAMSDYYKALDRFAVTMTLKIERTAGGQTGKEQVATRYTIDRPSRFAMAPVGDANQRAASLYVTAEKLIAVLPQAGRYSEAKSPESLEAALRSQEAVVCSNGLIQEIGPLFTADPRKAMGAEAVRITYTAVEKVGDVEAHRIRMHRDGGAVDWWIATGAKPLLLRVSPDLTQMLEQARAAGQDVHIAVAVDASDFDAEPELGDASFTFKPGEGLTKVDSLFEAAQPPREDAAANLAGKPAPDFTLDDLEGKPITLADHKGKSVVVLDFWATWCGPCRVGMPDLAAIAAEYADKGVVVYAVNLREDKAKIGAFLEQMDLDLHVLLDARGETAGLYGVTGIPQTVIIAKDGTIKHVHIGLTPKATLTREVDALLK